MNPGKVYKKIDAVSFAVYFVGWVKPYTAYPARDAFWRAAFFPGFTMKNYVLIGRDTIEKNVGNASLIPTYSVFKSLHGALKTILGIEILVAFSLKSAFKNIPGKTSS